MATFDGDDTLSDAFAQAAHLYGRSDAAAALQACERVARQTREASVFRRGEQADDVATADLPLALVEHWVGMLFPKLPVDMTARDGGARDGPMARLRHLGAAQRSEMAFLQRMCDLGVLEGDDRAAYLEARDGGDEDADDDAADDESGFRARGPPLASARAGGDPAVQRGRKIGRRRANQAAEARLGELATTLTYASGAKKEELKRESHTLQLQFASREALEELPMLAQEMEILAHMHKLDASGSVDHRQPSKPPEASRPGEGLQVTHFNKDFNGELVCEKEEIRGKVFQPTVALPTVSVEEYGEHLMRQMADDKAAKEEAIRNGDGPPVYERRTEQLEDDGDEDGPEAERGVERQRAWDDWCDENPKGSGNKAGKLY